tara:strand:+ start:931 stop:1374 length:444 start_codon:yes stop_codon:yes gene_type:complete
MAQKSKCIITDVRGDVHPGEWVGRPLYSAVDGTAMLSESMVVLFNWIGQVAERGGMAPPVMLSACRTKERQQELQNLWDTGQREGLAVRPVDNSKHIADSFGWCRAFDLGNDLTWLQTMGPVVVAKWPNIEWGGGYLPPDYRHFEER